MKTSLALLLVLMLLGAPSLAEMAPGQPGHQAGMSVLGPQPDGTMATFRVLYDNRDPGPVERGLVPRIEGAKVVHSAISYRFVWQGRTWERSGSRLGVRDGEAALALYRQGVKGLHESRHPDIRGVETTWLCSREDGGLGPGADGTRVVRIGVGNGMGGGGAFHPDHPFLLSVDVVQVAP